jgi:hypothetical protein
MAFGRERGDVEMGELRQPRLFDDVLEETLLRKTSQLRLL